MMLSTLTKLKRHLGIPVTDLSKNPLLETLLKGSSAYIEGQTARKLELQSHTLKLDGEGIDMLVLPQYPILVADGEPAITTLKIDDVDVDLSTLDIDAETGIIYHPNVWPAGRRNIAITYSAGYVLPGSDESGQEDYPTLPEGLELAAIRLAARVYVRRTAEGTSSVAPSSYSVQYKDSIDPEIEAEIARHARARI